MDVYDQNRAILYTATKDSGGWEAVAKQLRARGHEKVTRQHVLTWAINVKAGVPMEYLVDMEEITGISREKLRSDVPWRT